LHLVSLWAGVCWLLVCQNLGSGEGRRGVKAKLSDPRREKDAEQEVSFHGTFVSAVFFHLCFFSLCLLQFVSFIYSFIFSLTLFLFSVSLLSLSLFLSLYLCVCVCFSLFVSLSITLPVFLSLYSLSLFLSLYLCVCVSLFLSLLLSFSPPFTVFCFPTNFMFSFSNRKNNLV